MISGDIGVTPAKPGFEDVYNNFLKPLLEKLEISRKQTMRSFWKGVLSAILFLPASAPAFIFQNPWLLVILIVPVFLTIKTFSDYTSLKKSYVKEFKETIIGGMIKSLDGGLSYSPLFFISPSEYNESDLYRERMDRYHGEDLVEGMLGKTWCKFSELHHQEKRESTDSKGNRRTYWVTIFKGIFFIADFHKHFHGRTYVMPDASKSFLGIGKLFEGWSNGRGDIVNLENPEFEKRYTVYSNDQVESRYILSPAMMERLNSFHDELETYPKISFINSKVFISIPNKKNLFEPLIFKEGTRKEYLQEYFFYLGLMTGIVEDLRLNTRIWSKE